MPFCWFCHDAAQLSLPLCAVNIDDFGSVMATLNDDFITSPYITLSLFCLKQKNSDMCMDIQNRPCDSK